MVRFLNDRLGHDFVGGLYSQRRCIWCDQRQADVEQAGPVQPVCPRDFEMGPFESVLRAILYGALLGYRRRVLLAD